MRESDDDYGADFAAAITRAEFRVYGNRLSRSFARTYSRVEARLRPVPRQEGHMRVWVSDNQLKRKLRHD
jgi:hypothetical protein